MRGSKKWGGYWFFRRRTFAFCKLRSMFSYDHFRININLILWYVLPKYIVRLIIYSNSTITVIFLVLQWSICMLMYRNAQVSKNHANVHSGKMFAIEYKRHVNVHSGKLFRIVLWFMARPSSWLFYGIYIFVYATYVMMFFILKGKLLTLHKQLEGKNHLNHPYYAILMIITYMFLMYSWILYAIYMYWLCIITTTMLFFLSSQKYWRWRKSKLI